MSRSDLASNRRTRVIFAALGGVAALIVIGLAVLWLVARREVNAVIAHQSAVRQTAVTPGRPMFDPLLPAGSLVVDLVAAAPELHLAEPAMVHVATKIGAWAVDSPAELDGTGLDRSYPISITGPYLVQAGSFDAPSGSHGQLISLRAIPIDPAVPYVDSAGVVHGFEVDLTRADVIALRWIQGTTVLATRDVPRAPANLAPAALAKVFREEWEKHTSHAEPVDPWRDHAIVRAATTASFAEVFPVVEALLATKRPMTMPAGNRDVAAFQISVQPPLPAAVQPGR